MRRVFNTRKFSFFVETRGLGTEILGIILASFFCDSKILLFETAGALNQARPFCVPLGDGVEARECLKVRTEDKENGDDARRGAALGSVQHDLRGALLGSYRRVRR